MPITSLADAFQDQLRAYFSWNGRVIVHTLTAWFSGVLGMYAFHVANTVAFVLLCAGIIALERRRHGGIRADMCVVVFALFVLMPHPGEIFLSWVAICVNYLWTACAYVWFLVLYERVAECRIKDRWYANVGLMTVALLAGSLQESFSLGISAGLFFYYCFNFKKFRGQIVWLAAGFWIGTVVVAFAPGNFVRLAMNDEMTGFSGMERVKQYIANGVMMLSLLKTTWLLAVALVVARYKDKTALRAFCGDNAVLLISIVANSVVALLTLTGSRQLTAIELVSLVLLLRLLNVRYGAFFSRHGRVVTTVLCAVMLAVYVPVYGARRAARMAYDNWSSASVESKCVIDSVFVPLVNEINDSWFLNNYVNVPKCKPWFYQGISRVRTSGKSNSLLKTTLPMHVAELPKLEYDSNGVYSDYEKGFYLIRRDADFDEEHLILKTERVGGLFADLRAYLFGRPYTLDITGEVQTVTIDGYKYYVYYCGHSLPVHGFVFE